MAQTPSQSFIVVGAGIVGLVIAVVALGRGHAVTVIARDDARDTASGVAAGMIAPALEALAEADPIDGYRRLKAAQAAWVHFDDLWPEAVRQALAAARNAGQSVYVPACKTTDVAANFDAMGAAYIQTGAELRIGDDWLVEAEATMAAFKAQFLAKGGHFVVGEVTRVTAHSVEIAGGDIRHADHVVVAAGFEARKLAADIPSLRTLEPIKGHLFDIPGRGANGVLRSPRGYLADYGRVAKFGASMQPGQSDREVEPGIVADLKARAEGMGITLPDEVEPRTGVRATTPDGWPLIGRDKASGVLVAVGVRRNGYIFAPFAAKIILALVEQRDGADDGLYRPDRF
ncbi:FAD-dependent oxidoreductase [Asticcacaulis sp. 201]|uniref:NAD(P)/FAD-dependent oxidoreductase n=1 Tax=Asticcacaulis sp. 201 TaxID=3028787 RepID=UPI0029162223|nr:FAD-dependent oxidoreductase [Asticcacaulis sp. 201]MDV6333036.1 FAD-dependent oxidoreductase [Asticcacaulis sp. 201]